MSNDNNNFDAVEDLMYRTYGAIFLIIIICAAIFGLFYLIKSL